MKKKLSFSFKQKNKSDKYSIFSSEVINESVVFFTIRSKYLVNWKFELKSWKVRPPVPRYPFDVFFCPPATSLEYYCNNF